MRINEKALQKYLPDVEAGTRLGPAIAWLIDVVRCSIMCKTPAEMLQLLEAIEASELFVVVRLKNYFVHLDPTHFRRLGLTVLLVGDAAAGRPPHYVEIQLHLSPFFKFKSENKELMHVCTFF